MDTMENVVRQGLANLLANADTSQAAFPKLAGVMACQASNWRRGRAAAPRWAMILAAVLPEFSPDALDMMLQEAPLPPVPPWPDQQATASLSRESEQ